jgi:hypothetical protein
MFQIFVMLLYKFCKIDPAQSNKISASNPNIHSITNALHRGKEKEEEERGWDKEGLMKHCLNVF